MSGATVKSGSIKITSQSYARDGHLAIVALSIQPTATTGEGATVSIQLPSPYRPIRGGLACGGKFVGNVGTDGTVWLNTSAQVGAGTTYDVVCAMILA